MCVYMLALLFSLWPTYGFKLEIYILKFKSVFLFTFVRFIVIPTFRLLDVFGFVIITFIFISATQTGARPTSLCPVVVCVCTCVCTQSECRTGCVAHHCSNKQ